MKKVGVFHHALYAAAKQGIIQIIVIKSRALKLYACLEIFKYPLFHDSVVDVNFIIDKYRILSPSHTAIIIIMYI